MRTRVRTRMCTCAQNQLTRANRRTRTKWKRWRVAEQAARDCYGHRASGPRKIARTSSPREQCEVTKLLCLRTEGALCTWVVSRVRVSLCVCVRGLCVYSVCVHTCVLAMRQKKHKDGGLWAQLVVFDFWRSIAQLRSTKFLRCNCCPSPPIEKGSTRHGGFSLALSRSRLDAHSHAHTYALHACNLRSVRTASTHESTCARLTQTRKHTHTHALTHTQTLFQLCARGCAVCTRACVRANVQAHTRARTYTH